MENYQKLFERKEIKYLVSNQQWEELLIGFQPYLQLDQYGKHLISNIYYDTENWYLVRQSISKPIYKEKIRLRSYGVPKKQDAVFIEIKKKYAGIVYKRRTDMRLKNAERFLANQKIREEQPNNQIIREFQSTLAFYPDLKPAMYLSYERMAYAGKEDDSVRITFDQNILYRTEDLSLASGSYGKPLLPENHVLMEIKIGDAMPLWLARLLSEKGVYPAKFSKYSNGYGDFLKEEGNAEQETSAKKERREVSSA